MRRRPQAPVRAAPARAALACAALACAALACAALLAPAATRADAANAGLPGAPAADPLAGIRWGNYTGPQDEVFPAYEAAGGQARALLAKIALRPRVRWFGAWYPDGAIARTVRAYIAQATGGDPSVLAQLAVFRLVPWEHDACLRLPSAAEQASYRLWIDAFALAVGSSRVALILQPDLPFAACVPHRSRIALQEVAYAARVLSALPHASVYIDAGAADWPSVGEAVALLRAAGVGYARGFALNATHYDATATELAFGARIARRLARAGVPGRHFVVNTASNGRPFTFQQYHGASFDNAATCRTRASRRCVTLGIPPTTDVASRAWGLPAAARRTAARLADAYLWVGRPWLDDQADPFDLGRSLQLAATTPF